MDGIDRISSLSGVKIELYPLVDAPLAHERQQKRSRSHASSHENDGELPSDDPNGDEEDNGAYDDHGHLVHEHGEDLPPDVPHINIVV
ncbi:MAG: hypothetical protein H7123_07345 [Thermoleophilia bacterium]|nr:hypothetical protein [Thermoleophilia bacterium]